MEQSPVQEDPSATRSEHYELALHDQKHHGMTDCTEGCIKWNDASAGSVSTQNLSVQASGSATASRSKDRSSRPRAIDTVANVSHIYVC